MAIKPVTPASKTLPYRSEYDTHFDRETQALLRTHAQDDLFSEIELIRYLNLVTLKRMNAEGSKLSYRDHLATLRAVTLAAGEIAHLASTQNKVFSPLVQLENKYKLEMENTYNRLLEVSEKLMGAKKVDKIKSQAIFQKLRDPSGRKVV